MARWFVVGPPGLLTMSPAHEALVEGFLALREQIGRVVTSSAGDTSILVLVQDRADFGDPTEVAKAKSPVIVTIRALADDIANPRAIETFTEDETDKVHKVLAFNDGPDPGTYEFTCESDKT